MIGNLCCNRTASIFNRDVPDIRFRFLLAGYPAVFFYPVPAPVPAEMVPGTGLSLPDSARSINSNFIA